MTPRESLLQIYALYDRWAGEFDLACRKGCATCCTQSVTMTTLEGELMVDYLLARPDLLPLPASIPGNGYAPPTTTNQFAAACLRREYSDEPSPAWDLAPCLFLKDNCCVVYPVRPFMCRSFGSTVRCDRTGTAEIEPFFLTLNTVILQCIEHLDRGRPWGNMYAVLRSVGKRKADTEEITGLLIAEPIPGFFIPPDEKDRIQGCLRSLLTLLRETRGPQER